MINLFKKFKLREYILILICIALVVVQVWLDLKLPDYMSTITRFIQTEGTILKDLFEPGTKMLLCALGSLASSFIVGYCAAIVAATFARDTRKQVFTKVEDLSMAEIKSFSTSSLITRTTNDITNVQMLLSMGLQLLIKAPILATWAICKIANKNWQWSMATGISIIILLTLISIIVIFVLPKFKVMQNLTDNLNRLVRENLTGIRVVRAFNAEKYQEERFEKANDELTKTSLFVQKVMGLISPFMNILMSALNIAIYAIGAYLINQADFTGKLDLFTDMIVFSSYAMQVVMSFIFLAMIFIIYPRASVSAKRINEVLKSQSSVIDGEKITHDEKDSGTLEFIDVSFKYPDAEEYMLENISFKVNKGETIAFIGSTGSGKSTLINLVPRFYDATSGEIILNGNNIKDYKINYIHNLIGYISQKAVMFNGSIKDNISFGNVFYNKPTDKQISDALKVSQAKEFVTKLPEELDYHIAEGGTNVSGGQKQRLSIARAIARTPEFYIFDDTFSALDYKTDATLRKELKKFTKDATVLIVAQRIGTIKNADKIVVLESGKCVGMGTHSELLKNCEVYKEIALSQLSKEELENA